MSTFEKVFVSDALEDIATVYHFHLLTDFNECLDEESNNCDLNADCINIDGSFTCACKPGWTGDGIQGTCQGMKIYYNEIDIAL